MTVLVLLEHDRGVMAEAAREALTSARDLAAKLDSPVHALLIGADAEPLAAEAHAFGAEVVHVATHELLTDYGPDAWAETTAQLAEELDADVVMTVGSDRGNEVMAQVAAKADLPFVANCTAINTGSVDDEAWTMTRIQWGGSLLEDVTLNADRKLVSFGHHAVAAEPAPNPGEASIEEFEPELDEAVGVTMVKDRVVLSQGVTLSTSPVVISGGRGVGSADGFAILEELAELLEGRVGCSRAVTNNGWRPHADQAVSYTHLTLPTIYSV